MIRKAKAVWQGTGRDGSGHLSSDSGVLAETPYSFKTRFENEKGTTLSARAGTVRPPYEPRRMREMCVRGVLIYCADYHCSHSVAMSADRWPDEMRLSDVRAAFRLQGLRQARRHSPLPADHARALIESAGSTVCRSWASRLSSTCFLATILAARISSTSV
jgi:hypothetical protein